MPSAPRHSVPASAEWFTDSTVWHALLRRSAVETQRHMKTTIVELLTTGSLTPQDLITRWLAAGVFSGSKVPLPVPNRLAAHAALLGGVPSLGPQLVLELFAALSAVLPFQQLDEECLDLLVRLTQTAAAFGYECSAESGLSRSLALGHLLQFLHWCLQQHQPPVDEALLESAKRSLLHDVLPLPAMQRVLPAFAAEALRLATLPAPGTAAASPRSSPSESARMRSLCGLAVEAARMAAAGLTARNASAPEQMQRISADAIAKLCAVLPPVGSEAPAGQAEMQVWLNAFVDSLACFLRLPGTQIASPQVGTLWSRLIVRPLCGLPTSAAAMQYFKLAFLAQPSVSAALLAPLQAAPDPPAPVKLAFASMFDPSSFGEDLPPVTANFFLPGCYSAAKGAATGGSSPPPPPPPPPPPRAKASSPCHGDGADAAAVRPAPVEDVVAVAFKDPVLARPGAFGEYAEVTPLSGCSRILTAKRCGMRVVLAHGATRKASTDRELRALLALRGRDGFTQLQGLFTAAEFTYLELSWCSGGTLQAWCEAHAAVVGACDLEAYLTCQRLLRQTCQAVALLHDQALAHGNLAPWNVLLSSDHRPILSDFRRCTAVKPASGSKAALRLQQEEISPPPSFAAPEQEQGHAGGSPLPTPAADVYALGVIMAKAFLGINLDVAAYPYDSATKALALPDEALEADLADLVQMCLAHSPVQRTSAASAATHQGLEAAAFLRRRGLLGGPGSSATAPGTSLLTAAEHLREEHRGRRVDELIIFQRETVFETITKSKICDWNEETLLGEWRVVLDGESGVDGGGLRREVVSLFFEQLAASPLVMCAGEELKRSLFVGDRQKADRSPLQWRQTWATIGAMLLRSLVHIGTIPVELNGIIFDAAFGRLAKLPPDDGDYNNEEQWLLGLVKAREARGDAWARSELLDMLRRLRSTDRAIERGYRWMMSQCVADAGLQGPGPAARSEASAHSGIGLRAVETMETMLEPTSFQFFRRHCTSTPGVVNRAREPVLTVNGAVLEWTLLWDIYLKYIGGGDRWLAYTSFADGLTVRGRRRALWEGTTGEQISRALEGAALSAEIVIANLEFKPGYGYEKHIELFKRVLMSFNEDELSMFLRFATGIARLPASRGFPGGQKLTIRFIPDSLEKLPSAHTCFWVVDVPPYEMEEDMRTKLCQSIAAPQPFALS